MGKTSLEPGKQTITSLFFSMGLDMSWRLALSVLVPIVGGAELDNHYKTAPALLIAGFVVAIALAVVTIRRTLKLANNLPFAEITKGLKKVEDDDDD
jgi:F0F1-type ATP synthase assembly protein I